MTGPTHIAFANACLLAGAAIYRWEVPTGVLVAASIGLLLPDLDTPKSLLGRFFWFIASPLEKAVGHRGLTHSLLAIPIYLLLALPLWFLNAVWAYALVGGALSHLAIDTLTQQGIKLLWPTPPHFVLFANERWRMEVGGTGERLLLIGLCVAICLLVPVSKIGVPQLWARYVGDLGRAIEQYRQLEGQQALWLVGKLKDNLTEQRLEGRWRAIGTSGTALLILVDQVVRSVGTGEGHNLRPLHVHLEPGEPLQTRVATIELTSQALSQLEQHLTGTSEHWLFGELSLAAPLIVPQPLGRHAVLKANGQALTLDHARWHDVSGFRHLLVTAGDVIVKHRGTEAAIATSVHETSVAMPTVVVPVSIDLHRLSDLQVVAGDSVTIGQPLAINGQIQAELDAIRGQIAAEELARLNGVPDDFERLYRQGVIDRHEFLRFQAAKAKAKTAASTLHTQRAQLEMQRYITSQLSGTITSVQLQKQRGDTLTVELLIATLAPESNTPPPATASHTAQRPPLRPGTSAPAQGNTRIPDFDAAKRILPRIFAGHETTFYCGCRYGGLTTRIDWASCGYQPRQDHQRAARLEWEHVVPASAFGRSFREWQHPPPQCRGQDKRACLRKLLPAFARMEADLYNLMPAIGEVNGRRSNAAMGELWGERREFGQCGVEIAGGIIEPRPSVRGDIARIYFYMDWAYPGRRILTPQNRPLLEAWAAADPVDAWEQERARRIELRQGNRNPFIWDTPGADTARRAAVHEADVQPCHLCADKKSPI